MSPKIFNMATELANIWQINKNIEKKKIPTITAFQNFFHLYNQRIAIRKTTWWRKHQLFIEEHLPQVNNRQKNKWEKPHVFPDEFYKHFWSILAQLIIQMINESKQNSRLPGTSNTATISLPLKPNKDPTLPSNYQPISWINVDTKILAKAPALRSEKVIPSIILLDQTGLVKGKLASSNTHRLFNIMYYSTKNIYTAIVTLDAEKVF